MDGKRMYHALLRLATLFDVTRKTIVFQTHFRTLWLMISDEI